MISVGIDPSINSTGITVMQFDGKSLKVLEYHTVGYKPSKTTLDCYSRIGIVFHDYGKDTEKKDSYSANELTKTENLVRSADTVGEILSKVYRKYGAIDCVVMEGVSYGSTSGSSLVDLAGLNFLYRRSILEHCQNLIVASPMEIKKFATGNGGVDKSAMMFVWNRCENVGVSPDTKAKLDDIADSYFMAMYGMSQLCPEADISDSFRKDSLPYQNLTSKCRKKEKSVPEDVLEGFRTAFYSLG